MIKFTESDLGEPISYEEATKGIVPLDLPDEVINGDKKIVVYAAEKVEGEKGLIKLHYRVE